MILDYVGVPAVGRWRPVTVTAERLDEQVALVLRGWGMTEQHVEITVEHLTYADRHGIDSHGCAMLRHYSGSFAAGTLAARPLIEVVREGETTALVDGGGGIGHVPADTAMKLAIAKCRAQGLAAVAVRNSGHYGAAGTYAAMAEREGFIGVATTNTAQPALVPTGGVEAMLGTNPIAFAAPCAGDPPFLLDMATSTAPVGRLMTEWRSGRRIPRGWALGPDGQPVTNGRAAANGRRLTPLGSSPAMGSHKGYGLAAAVEILCSVLPGLRGAGRQADAKARVGHFFLVLDPKRFRDESAFERDLSDMMAALRATKPLDPARPVQVAGDPEHAAAAELRANGIPLARSVVEDLRYVCRSIDVPFVLDRP